MAEKDKKNLFGFFKKSRQDEEITDYLNVIKKDPENDRAYIRLAEAYARIGDDEAAIETYEKAALIFEKKGFSIKLRLF